MPPPGKPHSRRRRLSSLVVYGVSAFLGVSMLSRRGEAFGITRAFRLPLVRKSGSVELFTVLPTSTPSTPTIRPTVSSRGTMGPSAAQGWHRNQRTILAVHTPEQMEDLGQDQQEDESHQQHPVAELSNLEAHAPTGHEDSDLALFHGPTLDEVDEDASWKAFYGSPKLDGDHAAAEGPGVKAGKEATPGAGLDALKFLSDETDKADEQSEQEKAKKDKAEKAKRGEESEQEEQPVMEMELAAKEDEGESGAERKRQKLGIDDLIRAGARKVTGLYGRRGDKDKEEEPEEPKPVDINDVWEQHLPDPGSRAFLTASSLSFPSIVHVPMLFVLC